MNEEELRQQKALKFKQMGIPIPMTPIDPSSLKTPTSKKIEELKKLSAKNAFSSFIEREKKDFVGGSIRNNNSRSNNSNHINSNVNSQKSKLSESDIIKKAGGIGLSGRRTDDLSLENISETIESGKSDFIPIQNKPVNGGRGYIGEDNEVDIVNRGTLGIKSASDLIQQKNARLAQLHQEQTRDITNQNNPVGHLSDEELNKRIGAVCIKFIRKALEEYAKSEGKIVIIESNTIKKAEFIQEDVVKISGKLYQIKEIKTK